MGKSTDNSSFSTKNQGFIPNYIKRGIQCKKIPADVKYELTNPKNGKLTKVLKAIVEDLQFLLTEENSKHLLLDYKISNQLKTLDALLQNYFNSSFAPPYRIAPTVKKGTKIRVFKLARIDYSGDKEIAIIRGEQIGRGLKSNERKLIYRYMRKCGDNFPLDESKEYSWLKLKELLTKQMEKKHVPPEQEVLKLGKRIQKAREMIKKKIGKKFERKLMEETGCGFQVKNYGDPENLFLKK